MILGDLKELKRVLDLDLADTSEDTKLGLLVEQASNVIEEFLGRQLFFKSRTEYYAGTGTQKMTLRARPVHTSPTIKVFHDNGGYFGSVTGSFASNTELVYGTDFALKLDQEDGTSRSGILVRIDALWEQPMAREVGFLAPFVAEAFGNYKVTYTAGYTVDTLPAEIRLALNLLVSRLLYVLPLGMELTSESYEERAVSFASNRDYLFGLIRPLLYRHRNWKW